MNRKELAGMMDHTLLKAFATPADIEKICKEAAEIGAASVCVNPVNVAEAAKLLKGTGVKTCTVIGFPLGANTPETKAFETKDAIKNGAEEVDMVINVGAAKAGDFETVYKDIKAVVDAADGTLVKVIIETCYLTDGPRRGADEGFHPRHDEGQGFRRHAHLGGRDPQPRSGRGSSGRFRLHRHPQGL